MVVVNNSALLFNLWRGVHSKVKTTSREERGSGGSIKFVSWGLIFFCCFLAMAVLLVPANTPAQVATATLSGTVFDASGAVVPAAKVVVKNAATGATREMNTSNAGYFSFPSLQPGSYDVTITMQGFKNWELKGIRLSEAESRTLSNIQLQVGAASETVTVETGVEAIAPITTGANATTLNETMVTNLAIQGRDAAELIKLMPGMGLNTGLGQNPWNSLTTQSNNGPVGQFSASGTQPYGGLQLTVDGGLLVDTGNMGTQVANINQDQTAELTVRNSAFDAQYSRGPAVVEATGKSGSQQFHGGGYLYTRNSVLNSMDAQLKGSGITQKPNDYYYYPGFTLGGPVIIPGRASITTGTSCSSLPAMNTWFSTHRARHINFLCRLRTCSD